MTDVQTSRLEGYADAKGTLEYFSSTAETYKTYKPTRWFRTLPGLNFSVSRLGFGCYRTAHGIMGHSDALRHALITGTNVIDTSANYADGASEQMVGSVITDLIEAGRLTRNQVAVITKAGYIQLSNMAYVKENPGRFKEITQYSSDCWHCIHPDFLRDQLNRSLDRLALSCVDAFLLHNPEYYLMAEEKKGTPVKTARAEYERRLEKALIELEKLRQEGLIRYYGISSNTMPYSDDHYTATRLDRILQMAPPGFKAVQFPANLLESDFRFNRAYADGSVCALAEKHGLWSLSNRPLNAMWSGRLVRLAGLVDHPPDDGASVSAEMERLKGSITDVEERILEIFSKKHFAFDEKHNSVSSFINRYQDAFESPEHLQSALPALTGIVQKTANYLLLISETQIHRYTVENYVHLANALFSNWQKYTSIRYSNKMRRLEEAMSMLSPRLLDRPLAVQCLLFLLSSAAPVTVLAGMRRMEYVRQLSAVYELDGPEPEEGMGIISQAERTLAEILGER